MKKFVAILLAALFFALVLAQAAFAGFVTTAPPQSTAAATDAEGDDGAVRGHNIDAPITACIIVVCACIIYGIAELRKHKNDKL